MSVYFNHTCEYYKYRPTLPSEALLSAKFVLNPQSNSFSSVGDFSLLDDIYIFIESVKLFTDHRDGHVSATIPHLNNLVATLYEDSIHNPKSLHNMYAHINPEGNKNNPIDIDIHFASVSVHAYHVEIYLVEAATSHSFGYVNRIRFDE